MIEFIVIVLGVSLFLYAFLAGADFGAGIIEIIPTRIPSTKKMKIIGKAMGPVWEANHIWLILALVITFNAFPDIFWFVSEWFHFPLGALVIGIIFRGASFTFLHYDPIIDRSQKIYHWIFGLSSLWCTMWLGIIIGSLMLGNFQLTDEKIFPRYFAHWMNLFCVAMGFFVTAMSMFNASLFLASESGENRNEWIGLTIKIFILLILTGLIVHATLILSAPERWRIFFRNPYSIGLITASFLLLYPQFISIRNLAPNTSRILAGVQLLCIISAGFVPLYPKIIVFRDLSSLTVYETAAEPLVLKVLCYALVFGALFILPGYYFLLKIFKGQPANPEN